MKAVQFTTFSCLLLFLFLTNNVHAFTTTTTSSSLTFRNKNIVSRTITPPTTLLSSTETVETVSQPTVEKTTPSNNQAKYGNELELPDTYVRCGRCATSFALTAEDLGQGKGRRVECSVCSHTWFQSRDRLFSLNEGRELVPLPQADLNRIASNLDNGRDPDFIGNVKLFVGNLDFAVEEDDIRELFTEIGEVGDVSLVTGPDGRSKGFAFVTMMEDNVLDKCLELDGSDLKGRSINVKEPN